MATFTDVAALIPALCGPGADVDGAESAQASLMAMTDAEVVRVLEETADLARQVEKIQVAAAGVIAVRSTRERGRSGLSAVRGHRSATSLIQDVTGSTKTDASRKARVGEALLDEQDAVGTAPAEETPRWRAAHPGTVVPATARCAARGWADVGAVRCDSPRNGRTARDLRADGCWRRG